MARADIPLWTIVGVFLGMISAAIAGISFTPLGAIAGGIIGYLLAKQVKWKKI